MYIHCTNAPIQLHARYLVQELSMASKMPKKIWIINNKKVNVVQKKRCAGERKTIIFLLGLVVCSPVRPCTDIK